jgi:hypothetical protein
MTREEILRQMIDDYRRKIGTYEAMIQEWEAELGVQSSRMVSLTSLGGTPQKKEAASEPSSLVKGLQFFNRSQTEAAKMFLEMVGYPLRTHQIIEGIQKGGVKVGGKTAKAKKTNLYTILHRSGDFGLVEKDTWGLTAWPGVRKNEVEEAIERAVDGVSRKKVVDDLLKEKK